MNVTPNEMPPSGRQARGSGRALSWPSHKEALMSVVELKKSAASLRLQRRPWARPTDQAVVGFRHEIDGGFRVTPMSARGLKGGFVGLEVSAT